jgi:hypothetical protein
LVVEGCGHVVEGAGAAKREQKRLPSNVAIGKRLDAGKAARCPIQASVAVRPEATATPR